MVLAQQFFTRVFGNLAELVVDVSDTSLRIGNGDDGVSVEGKAKAGDTDEDADDSDQKTKPVKPAPPPRDPTDPQDPSQPHPMPQPTPQPAPVPTPAPTP